MKTSTTPVPTREFLAVFGTYRIPGGRSAAEKLCSEMETKLASANTERSVTAYTYFVQVARARRAQFFGVRL